MKQKLLILVAILAAAAAAWYFTGRPADTEDGGKNYIGNSPDECSRIKFICVEGMEYFADDKGCGCAPVLAE